jgi:uncharacterized membrane protein YqjE
MPHEIHAESPPRPSQPEPQAGEASSWADSIFDLIGSRIALFQLEAKLAAARNAGRLVMLASAAFACVVTWLLLMAGIAGIMNAFTGLAWYWTCLILAGIHLLAVAALLRAARAPGPPAFEHTRSEFQKDREWLQNLQHRKSKP